MGVMANIDFEAREFIKNNFDQDWDRFDEIVRVASYELYYGPMGTDYWDYVEPLDFYEWVSWVKAIEDIGDVLNELPEFIYVDVDGMFLLSEPEYGYEFLSVPVRDVMISNELINYI